MAVNNVAFIPVPGQVYQGAHVFPSPGNTIFAKPAVLAGGLAAGGNIPTVSILSGAGTVGSITQVNGYDMAGNFILTSGSASIFGGSLAAVTFGQPLDVAPVSVVVDAGITSGTVSFSVGPVSISKTGFVVQGPAPVSATAYLISYFVVKSPLGKV